jgi:hypothetical protein
MVNAAVEIFLIWLIWPSSTYRVARKWTQANPQYGYKHWVEYKCVKREITAGTIAMNALNSLPFSLDDLKQLNELFAKIPTPLCECIQPECGAMFDRMEMRDLNTPPLGDQSKKRYVLETRVIGVKWKGEVLKKAEIVTCTPDGLMIHNLAALGVAEPKIVQDFLEHLRQRNECQLDLELRPSLILGFIQAKLMEMNAETLFKSLQKSHPDSDFSIIYPKINEGYNSDTMSPRGAQIAGQNCKIVEVIHPGLIRKHDKTWRINALVRIENQSRDRNCDEK